MKICFQHSGILPVQKYGGTERIIYWLMKELVLLGHEVFLIGDPQSDVKKIGVQLIPVGNSPWVEKIPSNIDLLHLFFTPSEKIPCPYVVTIEGNGQPGEIFHKNTLFISQKHAENHGSTHFVYNGLDPAEYQFVPRKLEWNNFLFLAKAKWKVKNLKNCVQACRKYKKHLHVAGGRAWTFSRYVHSYGMIGQPVKNQLLEKCDALLFPVRWHEPFGIAIIEAMAKGRPVIGSPFGSLPELIGTEGGIICENYKKFEEVIRLSSSPFVSEKVRDYFEKNFTSRIMTNSYIKYYEKICKGLSIHSFEPKTQSPRHPEQLLNF